MNGRGQVAIRPAQAIRLAQAADAPALAELRILMRTEREGIAPGGGLDDFRRSARAFFERGIADGSFVAYVAQEGGAVVATSGITFFETPPSFGQPNGRVAYLMNMYTLPAHRGRGLATGLLERIMAHAGEAGCEKVLLNASAMGRPLYEKYGFREAQGDMVYHFGNR